MPTVPTHVYNFFEFMRENISLQSNGMGMSLRESRNSIKSLMKEEGYSYKYHKGFISKFEDALMNQYIEGKDNNEN